MVRRERINNNIKSKFQKFYSKYVRTRGAQKKMSGARLGPTVLYLDMYVICIYLFLVNM